MTRPAIAFRAGFAAMLLACTLLAPRAAIAADASCKQLFKVRSKNSDTPTTITFVNESGASRGILWLGFDGHPKDYATLNPGEKVQFQTFLTHPWMITNRPGDCLKIVMPRPGGSVERMKAGAEPNGRRGPGTEEGGEATSCPPGTVPVPETDNCIPADLAQRCRDQREGCDQGVDEACRNLARWDCPEL